MATGGTVLGLTTTDGRRPRVAVVGGTPAGLLVAGVLIEQFGCSSVSHPNAEAFLTLHDRRDPVDLIVIDASVPGRDGTHEAEALRALCAVPVIAISDRRADAGSGATGGFAATVAKPYSPRELYRAMYVALLGPVTLVAGTA